MDLLKKDKDQILERIISKIIIFFVSFLVRSLLKSSGCKRFCNHFLFIGSSGYVYLSFFSVIEVRFILLKSRIIWGLNEPKAKTKMASSRSESRVQLFWEKHHLNLLKILTDIILALDKIKTIINIVLYQYRCTVTKKKNLFWKSTSCGKVLFWAGTDGSMKEKWKYFVYACIHLHNLSVLPDGKESFLTDVKNWRKMMFSNEIW